MVTDRAQEIIHEELLNQANADTHYHNTVQLRPLCDQLIARFKKENLTWDPQEVLELIWDYMRWGLLAMGRNFNEPNFPLIHLTERGRKCIEGRTFNPYDADSYVTRLIEKVPMASKRVCVYVWQASRSLQSEAFLAAAVMIGTASEAAVWELAEVVDTFLTNDSKQLDYRKKAFPDRASPSKKDKWIPAITVFKAVKEFVDEAVANKWLPKPLFEGIEAFFESIFWMIRNDRNAAGHPEGRMDHSQESIEASLLIFPTYYQRITEVASWMRKNRRVDLASHS